MPTAVLSNLEQCFSSDSHTQKKTFDRDLIIFFILQARKPCLSNVRCLVDSTVSKVKKPRPQMLTQVI